MKLSKDKTVGHGRLRVLGVLAFLVVCCFFCGSQLIHIYSYHSKADILNLKHVPVTVLSESTRPAEPRHPNCTFWDCFDVYACGNHPVHENKIGVYVYPLRDYISVRRDNEPAFQLTREYYAMLKAIMQSDYYTPNPRDACIFVPSIDMLNQAMIADAGLIGQALTTLPLWNEGKNHLIFNYVPGAAPNFNRVLDVPVDKSIIAAAEFDSWTYRQGFDVSIPLFSTRQHLCQSPVVADGVERDRELFLVSAQLTIYENHRFVLQNLAYKNRDVLVLQKCKPGVPIPVAPVAAAAAAEAVNPKARGGQREEKQFPEYRCAMTGENDEMQVIEYPLILSKAEFCLVLRGVRLAQMDLLEALASDCIPVIVADNIVLPFGEKIDWALSAVQVREADLADLIAILRELSDNRKREMRQYGRLIYDKYFATLTKITLTTLEVINERVFAHQRRTYSENNLPTDEKCVRNPLFAPIISPRSQGFTALILTYDRVSSLFQLVQKISTVSSLQKIIVVWNNQKKPPPHPTMFPKTNKPLKVIQTQANRLSNRFYPYEEIETEAILNIDDDIVMLTADELDFGYEVWREFPDRIVGYPSRTHVWDNGTMRWRYESEWTNQVSMVLTGAAFYHKVRLTVNYLTK